MAITKMKTIVAMITMFLTINIAFKYYTHQDAVLQALLKQQEHKQQPQAPITLISDATEPSKQEKKLPRFPNLEPSKIRFTNRTQAYEVLSLLDVYKPVDKKFYGKQKLNFTTYFYGYRPDDTYCDRARKHFVWNPQVVFDTPNIQSFKAKEDFTRKNVLERHYDVIDPTHRADMSKKVFDTYKYSLKANVTAFISVNSIFHMRELGKQFGCVSQVHNHIPGHSTIGKKDDVADAAIAYGKNFEDQPQCFNHDKYFPKTFILTKVDECREFFQILNSPEYEAKKKVERIVYIRKIAVGSHRGQGVQPVNQEEEDDLRKMYENGARCGIEKKKYIIQHYINNPLLINDVYKFDFRVFMLIASTDPLMVYYHDGYLRISLIPYDANGASAEDEKKMMLTNLMLNKDIYDAARNGTLYRGMDEEALMNAQQATVDKLGEYLLRKGMISDPNWTENYLRREMRKAMLHLSKMAQRGLKKDSRVFQVFGVDFMLDSEMNLWFIEANSGPAYPKFVPSVHDNMYTMVRDYFEIVIGLLRSRMRRVIRYVNQVHKDGSIVYDSEGKLSIKNLGVKRATFNKINQNLFEAEYEPSPNNTFYKVLDESKQGDERYHGLIEPECMAILDRL